VEPSAYALTITEFYNIAHKKKMADAVKAFAYIYFMEDPRSTYSTYDPKTRNKEICKAVLKDEKWKPDEQVRKAMVAYVQHDTMAIATLKDARTSVNTIRKWLRKTADDIDKEDDNGRPLYDPAKHAKILTDLGKIMNGMKDLEEAVKKELEIKDTYGGVAIDKYSA
jgi:hypothetical protein